MLHAETLQHATWECLHFISSDEETAARSGLDESGFLVFDIRVTHIGTKEALWSALAKEMRFPEYFGMNWDALDECLRDMSWLPAKGYVLFLRDARRFWQRASDIAGQFVESWLFAAEEWGHSDIPFHVVFIW
jgi:RNAse (barnase) inhibitor barstar